MGEGLTWDAPSLSAVSELKIVTEFIKCRLAWLRTPATLKTRDASPWETAAKPVTTPKLETCSTEIFVANMLYLMTFLVHTFLVAQ